MRIPNKPPIARNVFTDDLIGYESRPDGTLEMVVTNSFERDVVARGWRLYSRSQRSTALRAGTIVAMAHGWRIDGVHDLLFEQHQPFKERALDVNEPFTRFTLVRGGYEVSLDPSLYSIPEKKTQP